MKIMFLHRSKTTTLIALVALASFGGQVDSARCDSDILFILDKSGSVLGGFYEMVDYMKDVIHLLRIDPELHHVAVLTFSNSPSDRKDFGAKELQNNDDFYKLVSALQPSVKESTNTGSALETAHEMLQKRRPHTDTLVLVVSDGKYSGKRKEAALVSKYAKLINEMPKVAVYCIGVTNNSDVTSMLNVALDRKRVISQPDVLRKSRKLLLDLIGCKPPSTFKPKTTTTTATRTRPTTIREPTKQRTRRTTTRATTTTTKRTTTTTTTRPSTGCEVDLLLLVDYTRSVLETHEIFIEKAIEIVGEMKISPYHTRVSLVIFHYEVSPYPIFHFKHYSDAAGVVSGIRNMQRTIIPDGPTFISAGLKRAQGEFNIRYGARDDAKKVCVVFTDGHSWSNSANTSAEAKRLRQMGVEIYVVGVEDTNSQSVDMNQLMAITDEDQNSIFINGSFERLKRKLHQYNRHCRS